MYLIPNLPMVHTNESKIYLTSNLPLWFLQMEVKNVPYPKIYPWFLQMGVKNISYPKITKIYPWFIQMRSTMYITPKIYPWLIEIYLTQKIYPWILEIGSEMYLIPKLPMVLRNRVENVPDFYVMTVVRVIKNKLCQSNGRSNNHLTQGGTAMVHSHSRSEHPSKKPT